MARSSKNRKDDSHVGRARPTPFASRTRLPQHINFQSTEDRRQFHPDGPSRPARTMKGLPARIQVKSPRPRPVPSGIGSAFGERFTQTQVVPYALNYQDARRVLVCVRRKIRREVLHALKITGGKGMARPRFNDNSKISCGG